VDRLLWFNATVSAVSAADVPDVPEGPDGTDVLDGGDGTGGSRRRGWIALAAVAAIVVVAGAAFVVAAGGGTSSGTASPPPGYVEEARAAGIDHAYRGEFDYFVGGGVAAFDCNGDGRDDLYFAGGAGPAALYRNRSPVGGALRFEPVPSPVTDLTDVTGAYPLDVDSDGQLDLAVLRRGPNAVLRGLGDCRFEDATDALGLDPGEAWTTAFSATWEGTNELPTLAFGAYLGADRQTCGDSTLVRPAGDGERYADAIPLTPGYCTLSVLFSDWDGSGRRDLRVSNDRHYYIDGEEQLWRIEQGQPPRPYTEADGWRPLQIWGMGIASQDLTGDGAPEVFLTSQGDNKLQTLVDGAGGSDEPTYEDIALERGVTAQRPFTGGDVLPSTAWHPEFEDVNNDGMLDLFVTKGNVDAQPDLAARDPSNLLIGQADGTFVEGAEAAGIVNFEKARGAALVDLNLDGMLDLVVVTREANPLLWRNVGRGDAADPMPTGHWLAVALRQPAPNVDAVGAWIEVRPAGDGTPGGDGTAGSLVREITVGGGHVSGKAGWTHIGLGDVERAEVRVRWPDGETGPWMAVDADRFVTVERQAAQPTPWDPPTD